MHSANYRIPPALGPVVTKRSPSTAARSSMGMSSSPTGVTPSRSQGHYEHAGSLNRDLAVSPLSPMGATVMKSRVSATRVGSASVTSRSDLRYAASVGSPAGRHSPSPEVAGCPPPLQFKSGCGVLVHEWQRGECIATYRCGDLLGQGGFAKVFDFVDIRTSERFACKIVDKEKLKSESTRTKFFAEVEIHQRLKHPNILNFIRYFDDEHYYYLLLERCCRYSMMDLHMSRGVFTVPEIQHIMTQLLIATDFLHSNLVIHRDLKLGNIMIDPLGNIKVGDFGFATQLDSADQLKVTMCGTPNYIAPEVLKPEDPTRAPAGYSFSADIWSLGVILYTLAVGKPPFETKEVQTTYNLIRKCEYRFPDASLTNPPVAIPKGVRAMVSEMLLLRPEDRSSIVKLRRHPFLFASQEGAPTTLIDLDAEISPNSRSPINPPEARAALGPLRNTGSGYATSPSAYVPQNRLAVPTRAQPLPGESPTFGRMSPTFQHQPSKIRSPSDFSCGIVIVEYAQFPKYGWCYRALQADGRCMIGVTLNDCTKVLGDEVSNQLWYYNREKSSDRHMDKMFFFNTQSDASAFAESERGVGMSLQKKISILNFLKNHFGPNRDQNAECPTYATASSYYSAVSKFMHTGVFLSSPPAPVFVKQFQQHSTFSNLPRDVLMSVVTMRLSNGLYQHVMHVSACNVAESVFVSGHGLCTAPWVLDFYRIEDRQGPKVNVIFSSQLNRQCFPVEIPFDLVCDAVRDSELSLDVGPIRLPLWACEQLVAIAR